MLIPLLAVYVHVAPTTILAACLKHSPTAKAVAYFWIVPLKQSVSKLALTHLTMNLKVIWTRHRIPRLAKLVVSTMVS